MSASVPLVTAEIVALADRVQMDYRALVLLLAWPGVRLEEALVLTRADVDLHPGRELLRTREEGAAECRLVPYVALALEEHMLAVVGPEPTSRLFVAEPWEVEAALRPHLSDMGYADIGLDRLCTTNEPVWGYRTQKARGVGQVANVPSRIVQDESELALVDKFPVFARPCPVRPRHGFVDSVAVGSPQALEAVWADTRAADPDGELVIMPVIDAVCSAVLTAGGVSVGRGNDGATAGHESSYLPLAHVDMTAYQNVDAPYPYLEAVQNHNGRVFLVQLRAGPPLDGGAGDFIPAPVTVTEIVDATGDLLAWESMVRDLPVGAVVHHPGGTMLSHYAVHAGLNGLPVFFGERPVVGRTYERTTELAGYDVDRIRAGLAAGIGALAYEDSKAAVYCMLLALHHSHALRTPEGSYLIGWSAATMVNLGMAACRGEARHKLDLDVPDFASLAHREAVWRRFLSDADAVLLEREDLGRALFAFEEFDWSKNYGGRPWAECLQAVLSLEAVCTAFVAGHATPEALVTALNHAVNQAHHNGWWLDKFAASSAFDDMARGDVYAILEGAFYAWRVIGRRDSAAHRPPDIERLQAWALANPITPIAFADATPSATAEVD